MRRRELVADKSAMLQRRVISFVVIDSRGGKPMIRFLNRLASAQLPKARALLLCIGIVALTWEARADVTYVTLHSYGNGTVINTLATVIVIRYGWVPNGANDPEFRPDHNTLANSAAVFGTKYMNTVTQYYSQLAYYGQPHYIDNVVPAISYYNFSTPPPFPYTSGTAEQTVVDTVARGYYPGGTPANTVFVLSYPKQPAGQEGHILYKKGLACAFHDRTPAALNIYVALSPEQALCGIPNNFEHELAETLTDPKSADALPGWFGSSGEEIGDKPCNSVANLAEFKLLPDTSAYPYVPLQTLYSDFANGGSGGCVFSRGTISDTVVLGTNNQIYDSLYRYGIQYGWSSRGSPPGVTLVSSPATATSDVNGYQDVVALANTGDIWHSWGPNLWDNYYNPYYTSGIWVGFSGRPDIVSINPRRLDIYSELTGPFGGAIIPYLGHKKVDNNVQSPWEKIGSGVGQTALPFTPASSPGVTSGGPYKNQNGSMADEIDVVILDNASPQKNLWWGSSTDGSTFFWTNGGHPPGFTFLVGDPDVSSSLHGTVDIFVEDTDGEIVHGIISTLGLTPSNVQWDGSSLGSPTGHFVKAGSGVSAVGMGDGRKMISVQADNNEIWNRLCDEYGWVAWYRVAPGVTYVRPDLSAW
jgi:hypothetical protein